MHLEIRISVSRVTGRRAWKKGGKKEAQCPGEGIYNSRFGTMRTESVCVGRGHKSIDCLLAVTAHTKHTHTRTTHTHTQHKPHTLRLLPARYPLSTTAPFLQVHFLVPVDADSFPQPTTSSHLSISSFILHCHCVQSQLHQNLIPNKTQAARRLYQSP